MLKKVQLFILISSLFCIYSFGQNKVAHFTINDQPYSIQKDNDLDIMFVAIFNDLVRRGEAKVGDKDNWVETYYKFVNNAVSGTYAIEAVGDYVVKFGYSGISTKENLGYDPTGKNRKYRHCKEPYQRMSKLNRELSQKVLEKYNRERK